MTNIAQRLAFWESLENDLSSKITTLENSMDASLASNDPDAQNSVAQMRVQMAQLRAALGAARNSASAERENLNEEKSSRKEQNKLAEG